MIRAGAAILLWAGAVMVFDPLVSIGLTAAAVAASMWARTEVSS